MFCWVGSEAWWLQAVWLWQGSLLVDPTHSAPLRFFSSVLCLSVVCPGALWYFQVTLHDIHKRHCSIFTIEAKTQGSRQPCKMDNLQPAIGQHAPMTPITPQQPRVHLQAVFWPAITYRHASRSAEDVLSNAGTRPAVNTRQASTEATATNSRASAVPSRHEHASPAHELDRPTLRQVSFATRQALARRWGRQYAAPYPSLP